MHSGFRHRSEFRVGFAEPFLEKIIARGDFLAFGKFAFIHNHLGKRHSSRPFIVSVAAYSRSVNAGNGVSFDKLPLIFKRIDLLDILSGDLNPVGVGFSVTNRKSRIRKLIP